MLSCGGSRVCGCMTLNKSKSLSIGEEESSSCRSSVGEVDVVKKPPPGAMARKRRSTDGGFFKMFSPRNIFKGFRKNEDISMTKIERTMKAALLIQKWYRRYLARMEVRRRYTWTIFQSLEYAGEQDQVKLYNFFNALLTHMPETGVKAVGSGATSKSSSLDTVDLKFEDESDTVEEEGMQNVDNTYKGIHISFPLQRADLDALIDTFRKKKQHRLHARYVGGILKEAITKLKRLPNLNQASTAISKQVTICGDLHGKLDDLLVVFHKVRTDYHRLKTRTCSTATLLTAARRVSKSCCCS